MFTWFALMACVDWGSALPSDNTPPVAVAETIGGSSITLGETAALSGAASSDADGEIVGWQWSVQAAPVGSAAGILGAQSPEAELTPDVAGDYTLVLRVWDDRGDVSAADVAAVVAQASMSQGSDSADTGATGSGDTGSGL